jgi:hypothetical protein
VLSARRRDDPDQPTQERDGLHHQVGAAVGPGSLELVRDAAVVGPRQALQRERRSRAVPAQPLERVAIVLGDHDTCMHPTLIKNVPLMTKDDAIRTAGIVSTIW